MYLLACQVRVTRVFVVVFVLSLERCLTALCVESVWGGCFMIPFDCQ